MSKMSSNFRVSYFRNRVVAWLLLTIFSCSFAPSVSMAQQPTATIRTLSGNVLVSGQSATVGTVLQAGDTIETQTGASAVLELSDGSELHLGENTQINLADLLQTATGARVSLVKLMWGRIRAFLSPQHQIEGSSFDIETPNALIGVKFSEPDIEVSYSLEKAETVGIAHTVELLAKNLITDEETIIPIGSMAIITAVGIKVMVGTATAGAVSAGATGTGTTAAETAGTGAATTGTTTGLSTGTLVAIGAGIAAAAGGAAVAVASSDSGESIAYTDDGRWADCSQVHTVANSILMNSCEESHGGEFIVRPNRSYWVRVIAGNKTESEAIAEQPNTSLSLTMNGVSLSMDGGTVIEYDPWSPRGYFWEVSGYYCTGDLAPGDYTLFSTSRQPDWTESSTCIFRVK